MNYIDSHAYVWSNDNPLNSNNNLELPPKKIEFSPPELLLRNARPSSVEKFVLIQAPKYLYDNSYIIEQIKRFPKIFKAILLIDPNNQKITNEISLFSKLGINAFRIIITKDSKVEKYNKLLKIAERNNYIISYSNQTKDLSFLRKISLKYPNLRIVLENIGNIYNSQNINEKSASIKLNELCELSSNKNIYVQLSGLNMIEFNNYKINIIKKLINSYTDKRLLWGSNYPFQILEKTYAESISIIKLICSFLSENQKNQILSKTSSKLFFNN